MNAVRTAIKSALVPLLYRYPPVGLHPARLSVYLSALIERANMPGDVAEVGCNLGGTAAVAYKALVEAGWKGQYFAYDTFGGFVEEQYDADLRKGLGDERRSMFNSNSMMLARKVLDRHGGEKVQLIKGDATKLDPADLSTYSVVLADVDLSEPSYQIMQTFWPRLLPGGIMFCDDCVEDDWVAIEGYKRFCSEHKLPEEYAFGLGIVRKPA